MHLFQRNVACPFIRDPHIDEKNAKSLGISLYQYHRFVHIRKVNKDKSIVGRVAVAVSMECSILIKYYRNVLNISFVLSFRFQRKLCQVFQEPEIIADIQRSPAELSEQQLLQFNELAILAREANESSKSAAFVSVYCNFFLFPYS